MGGDFTPKKEDQWVVAEVAEGIREEDSTHPMSGHGSPENSAVVAFGNQKWLTVNSVYSYEKTFFRPVQTEYQRRPIRPFVLIESTYEGEHNSTPDQIRRQAYWAMLGGACGQFFGNNPIWHFDGPGLFPTRATWQESLGGTGSRDMAWLRDLFVGLPWHRLEPEQNHAIVTDGYSEGTATALTAQTADKRLSVTYIPSTGTQSRKLVADLGSVLRADRCPLVQPNGRMLDWWCGRPARQSRLSRLPHAGRQWDEDQRLDFRAGGALSEGERVSVDTPDAQVRGAAVGPPGRRLPWPDCSLVRLDPDAHDLSPQPLILFGHGEAPSP